MSARGPRATRFLFLGSLCLAAIACRGYDADLPAASKRFDHVIVDPTPNGGERCCTDIASIADLDGDGRPDLLIGGEGARDYGFVWYQAPNWDKRPIAAGDFTTDCAAADMDGDGDVDIVTGATVPAVDPNPGTYLLENPGDAGGTWPVRRLSDDSAHGVEAADLDGDGRREIVVRTKHMLVLLGLGRDGGVRRRVIRQADGEGIAIGDLDGDGRPDIVSGSTWYATPQRLFRDEWVGREIATAAKRITRVRVADLSGDGRSDVVLTVSEGKGPVLWFEAPPDPLTQPWERHVIEPENLEGAHSLAIADMDNDGDLDVVTAEMHTSKTRRVLLYRHEGPDWLREVISTQGSHNMQLGDLDGDGDIDILSKNYGGRGRAIEIWRNRTRDVAEVLALDRWSYIAIDEARPAGEKGKMGLVFFDRDGDGARDVWAGSFSYRNPGADLSGLWQRSALRSAFDPLFVLPSVTGEEVVLGTAGDELVELRRDGAGGLISRDVGVVPSGRTQGRAVGVLERGGRSVGVFTRDHNLLLVRPDGEGWSVELLSTNVEEEGVALGDIDGDTDTDIIVNTRRAERDEVHWLENRRDSGLSWPHHQIGVGEHRLDRVAVSDLDGDGDLDVVATEETPNLDRNAAVFWFEHPPDPTATEWTRRVIVTLRSVNSMSVADFDHDGDPDLAVAEHTDFVHREPADDNLTLILENIDGAQRWETHRVDRGPRSSHLGAIAEDLDGDGDLDLVSIAWQQFTHVHLWRNDAPHAHAVVADATLD